MKNKKETRPAAHKPAIQNLRKYLKEYQEVNPKNTLKDFAQKLDSSVGEIGRYLRGENTPRKKKVESWAKAFGVEYPDMMKAEFPYIEYPLRHETTPKKSGGHYKLTVARKNYDEMINEVSSMVREDEDLEYWDNLLTTILNYKP